MSMQLLIIVQTILKNPRLGYKVARMVGMIMTTVIHIVVEQDSTVKGMQLVGIKGPVNKN
jgi:hypothetical protein